MHPMLTTQSTFTRLSPLHDTNTAMPQQKVIPPNVTDLCECVPIMLCNAVQKKVRKVKNVILGYTLAILDVIATGC